MHKHLCSSLLGLGLVVGAPVTHADALDGLEMDVIGADERPEEAARRIELPDAARPSNDGADQETPGRDTAAEARERGSDFGQETAEEARERRGPPEGAGPPDGGGRPDNGSGNRPEDPGNDNRPDDPGGDRPSAPGGESPDAPAGGQPEAPDTERPDSMDGGSAPDAAGNAGSSGSRPDR